MRGALNILLLLISTTASLGVAEIAARWMEVPPATPRSCPGDEQPRESERFDPDPRIGWRMKPSSRFAFPTEGRRIVYQSDGEGLRTHAAPETRPAEARRRIVVAGDSYAWGYGVAHRDSVSGWLERHLPGTVVRNVAMPGFGLDQIWQSVKALGLPAAPDLLVVTIYPDDFERSMSAFRLAEGLSKPSFKRADGGLVPRTAEDCPGAVVRFLERRTRLHALARRLQLRIGRQWAVGEWWRLNAAILDALRADAEAASVPILFVHIPYETWQPFPALAAYMTETDTPFLDLYTAFGDDHERFYFRKDGHLNDLGHRRLAELIEPFVQATRPEAQAPAPDGDAS